ncbi:MAG: hypothetical protein ACI86X_000055 [Moritella sp.]|jgi:uncharacterized protein YggL (DUF469 family)
MATNRNRRLRKKLRVDEFQELGFDLSWDFAEGTTEGEIDAILDGLIAEVIDPNKLAFAADGNLQWDGMVCTETLGKCTESQREQVKTWLEAKGVLNLVVSPLFDLWYGDEE